MGKGIRLLGRGFTSFRSDRLIIQSPPYLTAGSSPRSIVSVRQRGLTDGSQRKLSSSITELTPLIERALVHPDRNNFAPRFVYARHWVVLPRSRRFLRTRFYASLEL